MTRTRPGVAAAVASLVLLGVGCSDTPDEPDLTSPSDPAVTGEEQTGDSAAAAQQGEIFEVAQATGDTLVAREAPRRDASALRTLSAADEISGLVVCLVAQDLGEWVQVHLPSGPAGRTGWVERDDVTLSRHRYRIEVSHQDHTLTLHTGEVVALSTPVAIGPDAPEPGERLFVKDLVRPPDPTGPYGRYAYGLSGSSNQPGDFVAGTGVVALHGTADPSALGADADRGAIAVGDDIVTRLVETFGLPLGTPVDITG